MSGMTISVGSPMGELAMRQSQQIARLLGPPPPIGLATGQERTPSGLLDAIKDKLTELAEVQTSLDHAVSRLRVLI